MKFSKLLLGWAALLGVTFGPAYVVVPGPMLAWIGLVDLAPIAMTDVRAMYAAFQFAPGLLCALALRRPTWVEPAVVLVATVYGGLASVRTLGILLDGSASTFHFAALVFEVPTFVAALIALSKLRAETTTV